MLSTEIADYKAEIENAKRISDVLISKGTLFQSRLDPELASLNRRWENISTLVKVKSLAARFILPQVILVCAYVSLLYSALHVLDLSLLLYNCDKATVCFTLKY